MVFSIIGENCSGKSTIAERIEETLGGAFSGKGWPEIVDFGVLEKYQRKGIGSKLMEVAEQMSSRWR